MRSTPVSNALKLFTVIIYGCFQCARVFVSGKPFHSSVIVGVKAKSLTYKGPSSRCSLSWVPDLWTRQERHARDKHSSLSGKFVNYGRKELFNTGPILERFPEAIFLVMCETSMNEL
jgi:hypothetical protein